ncbi:MAG: hypothetical protein AB7F91_13165 [Parvularculaceae bacterium]
MGKGGGSSRGPDGAHGYLTSALVFAGVTALWAVIVRDDPYYRLTDLFGARVPAMMVAYLLLMPLAGFMIGRWRYQAPHRGGATGYVGKLFARAIQFTYVHLLIVLFTVAMATDYFLGLNIDDQVRKLDDRLFDLAARFAPWLAAYLTGFNLGRAIRRPPPAPAAEEMSSMSMTESPEPAPEQEAIPETRPAEPAVVSRAFLPSDARDIGDLAREESYSAQMTASGLPAWDDDGNDQPGFLPPQNFDKLRPGLRHLR